MKKYGGKGDVEFKIKSAFLEKFDHPFFRETLYFHEITNAHKYYDIEVP